MSTPKRPSENPPGWPVCKQCGRLMAVVRIEPDIDDGPELQMFACDACGSTVTRSVPPHARSRTLSRSS